LTEIEFTQDNYSPDVAEMMISEAADLLRALSFTAHHLVLIGGLVPSLLVSVLDPGIRPHVGTTDLDLCLTLALTEGDTAEYERIETVLAGLGFVMGSSSFRWERRAIAPQLVVEFFCPDGPDRPAGNLYRPRRDTTPTAKQNFGGKLSALALAAGELLVTDTEMVTREVALPRGGGMATLDLQVTGPLAFLVAKHQALLGRKKAKDAYDIVWLIESWPGGATAAAAAFSQRPAFTTPTVQESLKKLARDFASTDSIGARSYATFRQGTTRAERALHERQAVGAIDEFIQALPPID